MNEKRSIKKHIRPFNFTPRESHTLSNNVVLILIFFNVFFFTTQIQMQL
jgi:hypothetical protein